MAIRTKIEYPDSTVNPVVGCTGCELYDPDPSKNHCYAAEMCRRKAGLKGWPAVFTEPEYYPHRLEQALKWPDLTGTQRPDKPWLNGLPRVIFVNDLSDGFCPNVDVYRWLSPFIDRMAESPHVWMMLTKWPDGMAASFNKRNGRAVPGNFWLGTSVLRQEDAWRVAALLSIRARVHWLSMEPLLGPVDILDGDGEVAKLMAERNPEYPRRPGGMIDMIALGGESGRNARPMHPDWARQVRYQCLHHGIGFFFKQWGAWRCADSRPVGTSGKYSLVNDQAHVGVDSYPRQFDAYGSIIMERVGKKAAGRLLLGQEYNQMPHLGSRG